MAGANTEGTGGDAMAKELPFEPLDPQQKRVYAAELAVFPREKDKFLSLAELQVETDKILAAPWFIKAYGEMELTVKDGRGSKWSRISDDSIHLLKVSRVLDVLVHELIHHVIPGGTEWHGAVFCGTLLYFIGKVYGQKTKDKLRREFKRKRNSKGELDPDGQPVVWDKRMARFGNLSRPGHEGEK